MSINNLEKKIDNLYKAAADMTTSQKAELIEQVGMLKRAVDKIDLPLDTEVQTVLETFAHLLNDIEVDLEYS